jgi:hypothetical protein
MKFCLLLSELCERGLPILAFLRGRFGGRALHNVSIESILTAVARKTGQHLFLIDRKTRKDAHRPCPDSLDFSHIPLARFDAGTGHG